MLQAVREPYLARAVIFALLLSREDQPTRNRQWQLLQQSVEPPLLKVVQQLSAAVDQLPPDNRLAVADMAIPALKRLSPPQYSRVPKDRRGPYGGRRQDRPVRVLPARGSLRLPGRAVWAAAGAGGALQVDRRGGATGDGRTFRVGVCGAKQAGRYSTGVSRPVQAIGSAQAQIVPPQQCMFDDFDAALGQLAQAAPAVKRQVLDAVVACIAADGKMTIEENELLRAVAAALSCPLPPVPVAA